MSASEGAPAALSSVKLALLARQLRAQDENASVLAAEPIAIVGLGCRFPGGADTPERFWTLLSDDVDAIGEIPADRWDVGELFDPDPYAPGTINSRWGGFIDGVDQFDAGFFGISPREAARMDPQQRLVLEVAVEAFERAGQPIDALAGTLTGVFIGSSMHDYGDQMHGGHDDVDAYSLTGNLHCILANRTSYLFDLRGPSVAIDTACSSSLVAVHMACQSLRSRDSDMALAGGVNLLLSPDPSIAIAKWGLMAPDGRCKTFDASANGFVRSDGCGLVVLKRLSDAIADNDPIVGVIRGSAVNQDGRSTAMSAPNGLAQQDVVRRALSSGRVAPSDVSCIEAHGTGTEIGDPIEVEALAEVLGRPGHDVPSVALTAVKTNIGHLEAAAGVAGLIKLVLCLQHEQVIAPLHFEQLNPHISFDDTRLFIPTDAHPWPAGERPRIGGVSSFGIGGTNAHAIVEEAPTLPPAAAGAGPYALLVSGRTPRARAEAAGRFADHLSSTDGSDLADVCSTAALRRTHHDERGAVVGATREQLVAGLRILEQEQGGAGVVRGRREPNRPGRVAFVFSGQGTQWWAMGRELLGSCPVFREVVERCDELLRQYVDWSLLDELSAAEADSRLDQTEIAQPAIFALQAGLAARYRSWGIAPVAVAGHSVGEVAAAHVSGALDLEQAVQVIAHRGRLMQVATGNGTMASIDRPAHVVEEAIRPYGDRLSVAALNSPSATVVSGEVAAMEELTEALRDDGVEVRPLPVDYAFHSTQMRPIADELATVLDGLRPGDAEVRFVSAVSGTETPGTRLDAEYWADNVRQPVRFAAAVDALAALDCDTFVEVGPHPVLGGAMTEQLGEGRDDVIVPSLRRGRPDQEMLYATLAQLHCAGIPVDWAAVMPGRRRVEPLPTYPWQHERHWFAAGRTGGTRRHGGRAADPLLGQRVPMSVIDGALFESELSGDRPSFLADHRIGDITLVPAMAFLELGLAAFEAATSTSARSLVDVDLHEALALADDSTTIVQTYLSGTGADRSFQISSSTGDDEWTLHASGTVRGVIDAVGQVDLDDARARCPDEISGDDLYDGLARRSTNFGAAFRGVTAVAVGRDEALSRVSAPPSLLGDLDRYRFHPALLDAAVHAIEALLPDDGAPALPVSLAELRLHRDLEAHMWSDLRVRGSADAPIVTVDVTVVSDGGDTIAELVGLRLVRTEVAALAAVVGAHRADAVGRPLVHAFDWMPVPVLERSSGRVDPLVIVADRGGVGAALAELLGPSVECVVISPDDDLTAERVAQAVATAGGGVVYLRSLDTPSLEASADPIADQERGLGGALTVVQAEDLTSVWLVTRGAQPVHGSPVAPEQATTAGLGATVAAERPDVRCVRVDLDPAATTDDAAAALVDELFSTDDEELVGYRDGGRFAGRLVTVEADDAPHAAGPTRLASDHRGSLDALHRAPLQRREPTAGEIEIRVRFTGLNFRDVLIALDMYPESVSTFGEECVGEVVRIGPGVDRFRPGDRVVAVGSGSFADYLVTDHDLAVAVPDGLDSEAAATIPIAYLTAYHSLYRLGELEAGERVLIHAAAGGVGMAAVQLAQHLGAEVFATAGSPEKRAVLESLGVRHIFDSRSTDFADGVLAATGGRGVDVVLNSLSGEFIERSFAALAQGGRFLEIGRRDIWDPERARAERPDASYFIIFLGAISATDPPAIQAMFRDLMPLFESGALTALPNRVFEADETIDAFRFMAQARHIGKIVVRQPARDDAAISADATYLVTGGLGGIGALLAGRLVELGARHVALVGRSDPTGRAEVVEELAALGADCRAFRCDVGDRSELDRLMIELGDSMPPLRGVIHAAGVTDDAVLGEQAWSHAVNVLGPKLSGAVNLRDVTRDAQLDLFVAISAGAAVFGSPGQATYAAANSFLDAYAPFIRARDGVGLSIGWGPWDAVGMTARIGPHDVARMARRGLLPLSTDEALDAFERVIGGAAPTGAHVVVAALDADALEDRSFLTGLRRADVAAPPPGGLIEQWIDTVPGMRRAAVTAFVLREATKVLGLPADSAIGSRQPFNELGLDSLMAVELRNAVGDAVGRPQPATLLFDHPTSEALVEHLLELVDAASGADSGALDEAAVERSDDGDPDDRDDAVRRVAELSEEEAEAMLLAELGGNE